MLDGAASQVWDTTRRRGYGVAGEVCPPSEFELVEGAACVGARTCSSILQAGDFVSGMFRLPACAPVICCEINHCMLSVEHNDRLRIRRTKLKGLYTNRSRKSRSVVGLRSML